MIQLTRLNGKPLAVNADLIKFVEQAPDTLLTLVTGEKLMVRETTDEVLDRIFEFRRLMVANSPIGRGEFAPDESQSAAGPGAGEGSRG